MTFSELTPLTRPEPVSGQADEPATGFAPSSASVEGCPGEPPREPSGTSRRAPSGGHQGPRPTPERPLAVEASTRAARAGLGVLRYLDVVLVLVSVVPALLLGAPPLGYLLGAAGWIVQRVLGEYDRRWTRRVHEPLKQLGVIWLLAAVIVVAALLGGREDGLAASLVIFGAYSVAFAIKVLSGPPRRSAAG